MDTAQRAARTKTIGLAIASAALLAVVVPTYAHAAHVLALNVDAAFWIPHARMVAAGQVPNVDFVAAYAPGPFYLLALLGEDGLRSPAHVKAFLYLTQIAGAGLLWGVLRRLGSSWAEAALLASGYLAWICTCDGFAVVVEPFVTFFVLAALLVVVSPGGTWRALAAGALAGAAVLSKQYGVLLLPALGYAAAADVASPAGGTDGRRRRAALFVAGVPLPFLVYALLTGQDPVTAFVQFATYGGVTYPANGLRSMLGTLAVGRAARPLVPALAVALWLLWKRRTPLVIALSLGLACACVPLYVRTYDHYVQLAAPWAVLVVAASPSRPPDPSIRRNPRRLALAMAGTAWACYAIWPIGDALADARRRTDRRPIADQIRIARRVEAALDSPRDVLVLNVEWIYALSGVTQPLPNRDLRFREGLDRLVEMRDAARQVVFGPGPVPIEAARPWLAAGGFTASRVIDDAAPILVFDREPR